MTKKTFDLEKLKALADEIAPFEKGGDKTDLIHRLETEEKAKITAKNGQTTFALAGLSRSSSRGVEHAMKLWAQKARRLVLQGGAA